MKITNKTELMFSQAVALAQNGRMKSHCHAEGKELFIQNMDNTILMRFLPDMEFPQPLSFFANDYASPNIEVKEGQVTFIITQNGYRQEKTVGAPKTTSAEVRAIWEKHSPNLTHQVIIRKEGLSLLEDGLSHVEFHQKGSTLQLVQQNIYTGARVEVEDVQSAGGFVSVHSFPENFAPLGIRTSDLKSLFQFVDTITFYPQPPKDDGTSRDWMYFRDSSGILEGILSTCIFDELGYLAVSEES